MSNPQTPFNTQALICAVGMIVSCFLPWFEIHSSVFYMAYGASFNSGATGLSAGVGFIPLIGGFISGYMVYNRNRNMSIPGIAVLLFAIAEISGIADYTVNVNFGIGSASSRIGYGLYVLLGCSILYVLFTFKYLRPVDESASLDNGSEMETSSSTEPSQAELIGKTIGQSVGKMIYTRKPDYSIDETGSNEDVPRTRNWTVYWICLVGVLGLTWWLVSSNYSQSRPRPQANLTLLNQKIRLDSLIRDINIDIAREEYDLALSKTAEIYWFLSGSEKDEALAKEYDTQKRSLEITIANLKIRDSIADLKAETNIYIMLKEKHEKDVLSKDGLQKRHKFSAKIFEGTAVYKYPDPKAEIEFVSPGCTVFITTELDNGFYYCQLDLDVRKFGWIRADELKF